MKLKDKAALAATLGACWASSVAAQTVNSLTGVESSTPTKGSVSTGIRSSFGPPPTGAAFDPTLYQSDFAKAAAASGDSLAVRTRASMSGNPSALASFSQFDIQKFQGLFVPAENGSSISPLSEGTRATSNYVDKLKANGIASAVMNVYFDRSVSLAVGGDAAIRQSFLNTVFTDPDFADTGEIEIGRVQSVAGLALQFDNGSTIVPFRQQGGLFITTSVTTREFATYSIVNNVISYDSSRFETESFNLVDAVEYRTLDGVPFFRSETNTPFDFTGSNRFSGNYSLPIEFFPEFDYNFQLSSSCDVLTAGVASFDAGTSAACDASQSGYWNGLTKVRGPNGELLPDFQLTDSTGFNLRQASLLSPAPAQDVSAVPEPEAYVLMLAGLLAVGAAARRRKLA